ncbi:sigma factor-like helix-turn-helix DNA-binding protein [Rhodopseudomonas sp. P2A-2r]|uniref:sigma factor-like helix-turn-helix DNA-binding protein n=1 Tax=unclassified Rhodopseudomonas TaxID=2638247 RepID=UPI002233FAFE|nr:sigma factor-like helix-turn-helix DNA-binding protein [Rhodopseudomonas sp. P2A-2r]UZE49312.1 hypothetical protein ONR75_00050 [Rhodopseudomonas sp. P2A-2r]
MFSPTGDLFFSTIVRCSSLGKKTAIEILELVDLYHRDPWEIVGHLQSDDDLVKGISVPETPILTGAEQYLQSEKIIDILLKLDISTRLSNVVKSGEFDATTIADFIADPGELNSKFMSASNSGRKTAGEAMALLSHHVEMSRKSAESVVGGEEGADDIQPIGLPHDGIDDASPPRFRIQKLLAALQPKELQVLTERYGLDGRPPRTLNDIEQRVHVTRERVRQVEAKAIRRLQKTQRGRTAFEALIETENESTWCALCDASLYLAESQLAEKARGLDPIFLLAIDVVHEDVRTWISTIAHQSDAGWFRNLTDATRMMKSQTEIEVIANSVAIRRRPHRLEASRCREVY